MFYLNSYCEVARQLAQMFQKPFTANQQKILFINLLRSCCAVSIARKEANETLYWLNILNETEYLTVSQSKPLLTDCEELMRILTSIIKTTQLKL